jgi:hypothetical protein
MTGSVIDGEDVVQESPVAIEAVPARAGSVAIRGGLAEWRGGPRIPLRSMAGYELTGPSHSGQWKDVKA